MADAPPLTPMPPSPSAPSHDERSRVAPAWHTVLFVVVTLALTAVQAHQQPKMPSLNLPSRTPVYAIMIAFELFLLGYVWVGLRIVGKSLREIIGGKWNRWPDFWIDVGIAAGFWCVVVGMLIAVSLVVGKNQEGVEAIKALLPRTPTEMIAWVFLSTIAGFCEELVFRGYLQRQFLALTRRPKLAVVCQALIFGAAHLYQGWKGAVTITVYGALFGVLAAWRKSLRPGMMQHAAQDTFSGLIGSFALRHHYF
ncbi:MAG TPA: type II CAAX endopeptidase family protein [Candidatus Acidoferrum sp.]|nr:type II CAAX endopeptidase family protein [Candidatus Acidoferrum sp.]